MSEAVGDMTEGDSIPGEQKPSLLERKNPKGTLELAVAQSGETERSPIAVKVDGTEGKAVVKEFKWPINPNLPLSEIEEFIDILDGFRDVFAFDASELGIMEGETYHIKLTDETPIFKQQYRLSQSEKEILREQMEERKAVGFIRTSTSRWAAPVTMPPKKDEFGNWTLKRLVWIIGR